MEKHFIRVIPFYSRPIVGDPDLEPLMPVALWRGVGNCCEGARPGSPCDDSEGLLYTIAGDEATFWCPLHWYEAHFAPGAGQRLVPLPEGQTESRPTHPQRQRIETALRHLHAVIAHWDEDQVLEYPAGLPSFDEYVAEVASRLRSILWAGEEP